MNGSPRPRERAGRAMHIRRARSRGFSLVELLVTIVLAGIIFAAMVPFFANALKRTTRDNQRNTAANIAQDRIEQIRLLSYTSITQANLTAPPTPFGDGRFGPNYTVLGSNTVYHVDYSVSPSASPQAPQKLITVSVPRPDYTTTMSTLIKNSDAGGTPNVTVSPTPLKQVPNASSTTVTWSNLTGGTAFEYTVTCHSTYITSTSPVFHLLKSARLKFDTHPGGS